MSEYSEDISRVEMFLLGPDEIRQPDRQPVIAYHFIWNGYLQDYPQVSELFSGLKENARFTLALWIDEV